MKKKQGFSLIELIVVIAIMVVLTVGITLSLSTMFNWDAKGAVQKMESQIAYTQSLAMTKTFACGEILLADDSYIYKTTYGLGTRQKIDAKKICSNETKIYYCLEDGSWQMIDESHPLRLSFQKSSGAFLPMIESFDENGIFTYCTPEAYCKGIKVVRGDYVKELVLYPKTGKVKVK